MSWGPLPVNLGVTAVTVAVLMLATFAYAMRTRVHAIMDTVWALGFVIIALVSFGLSAGHGLAARRVLVLALVTVWGVRLSAHIYLRNRGQAEDKRYASLLRRNTGSPARFVLRHITVAAGLLALARFGRGRVACVHDEHAGAAHRQAAAGKAYGVVQGGRVRGLCPADQRLLPVATLSACWAFSVG